ncbi:hypothetical protein [Winogradskyella sp.]|uniref:MORN repeat-containing protein n=1 Tax=Winogradskyella sp. TaxID=1883156 RepID=UPI0025D0E06E|nr:hypothetical protein [Winogradskyella sp.]
MKKQFSILLIVGLCCVHFCLAQDVPSQNKILDLPLIHLEKDFQLKTNKSQNAIPVNVEHISFKKESNVFKKTFEQTLVFNSKNKLIAEHKYHNIAFASAERVHKKHIYARNNTLSNIEFHNRSTGEKKVENTKLESINGKLSKHIYSRYGFGGDIVVDTKEVSYPSSTQIKIKAVYTTKTFTRVNNLITKQITVYQNDNKPSSIVYKYDNNGRIIYSEEPWFVNEYVYNNNGFLEKRISTERINSPKVHTTFYKYMIDEFGNWTMCMTVTNYSEYAEFTAIANPPKIQLRKITYANKKTTGTLDTESSTLKPHIEKFTKELRQLDNETNMPKGVVWKKNADGSSFWVLKDGKSIVSEGVNWQMGNTQLFFYKPTHTLYVFKNFREGSKSDEFHKAETLLENASNGFYYTINQKGNYYAFDKNGNRIEKFESKTLASNQEDVFVTLKGNNQITVMPSMKKATPFVPIAFENYDEYVLKNNDKTVENQFTLLKGNNQNGYAEVKLTSDQTYEGFYSNGKPYGLALIHNGKDFFHLRAFNGTYDKDYYNFLYERTATGELVCSSSLKEGYYQDYKTQILYRITLGDNHNIVSKSKVKSTGNTSGCLLGDCENGIGYYTYSDGSFYIGRFKNGELHHFGKMRFSNGDFYIGEFRNGKRAGNGEYSWPDKKYYRGQWKNNQKHGRGVMFHSETVYEAGQWENGVFKKNLKPTNINSTSSSKTSSLRSTSKISEKDKNDIINCKDDGTCLAKLYNAKYDELAKVYSRDELLQKLADYLASPYITPKNLFSIYVKYRRGNIEDVKEKLPQHVIDGLKNYSRELMNGYNKHINSKETQDKVKKNGGSIIKN